MRIIIAGDFVPRNRLEPLVAEKDFAPIFGEIKNIVSAADYAIVNFESPVVLDGFKPIDKCGPNLRCTPNAVEAVKWAGFDCCTLANNHILDYGVNGLKETVKNCHENGIDTVGVGDNLDDASKILYKEIDGRILAVINCCEHEFSIATETGAGANPLNPVRQYYAIQEARKRADFVLVVVHGGHEHYQLPSPRMVETYRYFIDCGADAVVNHHQHCFSGYEVYSGKPIFFGLGNFCFDICPAKSDDIWNFGYLVQLEFEESAVKWEISPYEQCNNIIGVHLLKKEAFSDRLNSLNGIIADKEKLQSATKEYYKSSMKGIRSMLNPTSNKYLAAAQNRGLLPFPINREWLLKLQNFVLCEAHRDKMDYYFRNR